MNRREALRLLSAGAAAATLALTGCRPADTTQPSPAEQRKATLKAAEEESRASAITGQLSILEKLGLNGERPLTQVSIIQERQSNPENLTVAFLWEGTSGELHVSQIPYDQARFKPYDEPDRKPGLTFNIDASRLLKHTEVSTMAKDGVPTYSFEPTNYTAPNTILNSSALTSVTFSVPRSQIPTLPTSSTVK